MTETPVVEAAVRPTAAEPALHQLLEAMEAMRRGDFSVRLPHHWDGLDCKLAQSFNAIAAQNASMAGELERIGERVGRHGETRERMHAGSMPGQWAAMQRSVNGLVDDLVRPVEEMTAGGQRRGQG